MSGAMSRVTSKRSWLIALCMGAALASSAAFADSDKHRGSPWNHDRGNHHRGNHDRGHDRWHDRGHDGRREWSDDRHHRDWDRRSSWHDDRGHYDRGYHRPDWRYHSGRYWAPAYYRGDRCDDRRHFHGVHYHVAVNDYYEYYYPRYRYYGPLPHGANASVIISLPLF